MSTRPPTWWYRPRPNASVVGGVTFLASSGGIAGVASVPVISPDVASRAPQVEFDPSVGR